MLEQKAFTVMCGALRRIEHNDDRTSHPDEALTLAALNAAWNIVDSVHRLRGLVRQVPKLSQKSPEVQLFIRSTRLVEEFRNLYQHLNADITRNAGKTNPIMGVLSWVTKDPTRSITVFVGTGTPDIQLHTIAIDRQRMEFAQRFLFSASNKDIDLEAIHKSCKRFQTFFDTWLNENGHLSEKESRVGVVRFQFRQRS